MKLKNKKTWLGGRLVFRTTDCFKVVNKKGVVLGRYKTIAELNDEWEVKQKPKKYWFIDAFGNIVQNEITKHYGNEYTDMSDEYERQKQIGNYFETQEEAEKAVEKLKALKRLKDKGFRFDGIAGNCIKYVIDVSKISSSKEKDELNEYARLIFGGGK